MNRSVKVAVIGAGVSGLVAARELRRERHHVVVFEQNDRIGGNWVYDPRTESDPLCVDPNRETVHGSLYASMRTNLPRALMSFRDYPFLRSESDPRTFPGHEEVLRFLDGFAAEFGIHELTRFNTRVERVEGRKNEWMVEYLTRGSESVTREVFEAIVVCSGHNTEVRVAEIPGIGNWKGYQMHSHNYRVPEPFHNQIVLLVGYGPSAFDISVDILPVAKEVHIACKENRFGVKFERVKYHDMIKCVNEDGSIAFEDGSSILADTIIHCTGYKYHFPFLETNGIVTIEDQCVGPLYKHIFPPALAPWLSFIGVISKEPIFLIVELQSMWVARVLSGKILLPTEEEMMDSVQYIYQEMEKNGLPKSCALSLRPLQVEYKNWLAAQIGLPPLEEWRENLLAECFKILIELPDKYRDQWNDAYWDAIIQTTSAS
ncbi:flavin-containing monooxygenase FMO GS-OX-like 4 [Gastrolobium bilobum]|uniref:flavin-containing monooxygenase FMO GS-OX-like 4 n=1 Tax=Gastrolobium bilobum TaxID=150636 RepID=UPI002AAF5A98|nr:flavin-containing monooxygenase FMO GS-OX-like 4 [Gastrolobium bilobum]